MMKGVILVVMVLMAAVFFAELACGQNALSIPGYEVSRAPATDADTKRIEDRMSEALSGLIIHRPVAIDNKITENVSPLSNTSIMNSSRANSSVGALAANSTADPNGIESNSKTNFKGYYGITASQHEMGKNDIDSRMLLRGTFALDKSVKFQDRGV
jgi:hypothetical protein